MTKDSGPEQSFIILHATGKLDRRTTVRELHVAFKIHSVCNFVTKLCRKRAEVIQNHLNANVRAIGQGEAMHRKYVQKS
jgi:hypothetical protein